MRDRVKRERSANLYYREPSREDSLYGRKRASYEIEKVRKSVRVKFGVNLELEVRVWRRGDGA